jgi:hypothetical protein
VAHALPVKVQRRYITWIMLAVGVIAWHLPYDLLVPAALCWPVMHIHHFFGFTEDSEAADWSPLTSRLARMAGKAAATVRQKIMRVPLPRSPR